MRPLAALVVFSVLAACSKEAPPPPASTAAPPEEPSAPALTPSALAFDLPSLFGAQIEVAPGMPAEGLRGDFNGDQVEDHVYLVKSSSLPPTLAPDVRVQRPFRVYEDPATPEAIPGQGGRVSVVIVHGQSESSVLSTFVLHDDVSQGPLDSAAKLGMRLVKRAEITAPELTSLSKGDVLTVPSEAGIDNYVFWSGIEYQGSPPTKTP